MSWKAFKKVARRRGVSKWGTIWIDRPCVNLNKNGLSFNKEAAAVGIEFGVSVEVMLDEDRPSMVAFRILEKSEAEGACADRAWIVQRNGSGKRDYGTRISNRGIAATIGERFFGACSVLEKQGSLLIAQFRPRGEDGKAAQPAKATQQINLDALQAEYPDEMIVSGAKQASASLGLRCSTLNVQPIETVKSGAISINRYRVGDLRRWHATTPRSPWAVRYGNGSGSVSVPCSVH